MRCGSLLGQRFSCTKRGLRCTSTCEGGVTDAAEAMDLLGLDDKNVASAGLELLSVDDPETTAFPHELDFIVRMTMGSGATPRKGAEEEHGDIHVPVVGPDEVVRAALKWQVLLTDVVHPLMLF